MRKTISTAISWARLSSELAIPIFYDAAKMASESGFSQDIEIVLRYQGIVRTFLDMVLEPYDLTYVINEAGLEVITLADAASKQSIGVYDLSFVAADSENAKSILQAIGLTIKPQGSDGALDVFMVGQMLVVSATERSHVGSNLF